MVRSLWKGPYFDLRLFKSIQADVHRKGVTTYARSSTIIPAFVGAKLFVHNGNSFVPLVIGEDMVGRKIGAFVSTIKKGDHPQAKAANQKPAVKRKV